MTGALLLSMLAVGTTAWGGPAEAPRLNLSWHAPHGMPRASDTLIASCDDTLRVDTLYMSFESPRPLPALTVVHAAVNFRPQVGDTLDPFWMFKTGWANGGNMLIDFAPFDGEDYPTPWTHAGVYDVAYDRHKGGGQLDLRYFVDFDNALGIDPGIQYSLARIRIFHRRSYLPGCTQPAGVEWSNALFGLATGRMVAAASGGKGVARWNAGRQIDFGWPRATSLARPWVPKSR
jgi:hypothetical protein